MARRALPLIALFFAADILFSLFATCEQISYYPRQNYSDAKYCTAFGGPLIGNVRLFFAWIWYILHEFDKEIVALFTAVLTFSTIALWWTTRNLWQATKDTAQSQAKDTRILQRAYISVRPRGISLFLTRDAYSCDVSFFNAGNLPARNVRWTIDRIFSADRFLQELEIHEDWFEGRNVIAPGTDMRKGGKAIDLQTMNKSQQREGDKWLYVWGEVRYDDGFGNDRFTKFCLRYNLAAVHFTPEGAGIHEGHARYHIYGNDAD